MTGHVGSWQAHSSKRRSRAPRRHPAPAVMLQAALMRSIPMDETLEAGVVLVRGSAWLPVAEAPLRVYTLALRAQVARVPSLRQQPFGEVQALLRLAHLLPQPAHVELERLEASLDFAPAAGAGPQALGPEPEPQPERRVNHGMQRRARAGREAGGHGVG